MPYPVGFFEIQEFFARRVSAVLGIPFDQALLTYTSYYKRIGIDDYDFNAQHPLWIALMQRIHEGAPPAEAAHALCQTAESLWLSQDTTVRYGCVGYDRRGQSIKMHFRNTHT